MTKKYQFKSRVLKDAFYFASEVPGSLGQMFIIYTENFQSRAVFEVVQSEESCSISVRSRGSAEDWKGLVVGSTTSLEESLLLGISILWAVPGLELVEG